MAKKAAQAARAVTNRWTPRLGASFTPVSDFFLTNYHRLDISHTEAMVIIHLMSFKWDAGAPFPALKTIGNRMGITSTSVRTHVRKLEVKGFLAREMQVGTTNRFHLQPLFRRLEELLTLDEQREAERVADEAARMERLGYPIPAYLRPAATTTTTSTTTTTPPASSVSPPFPPPPTSFPSPPPFPPPPSV